MSTAAPITYTNLSWRPVGGMTRLKAQHNEDVSLHLLWRPELSVWELFIDTRFYGEHVSLGTFGDMVTAKLAAARHMTDFDK